MVDDPLYLLHPSPAALTQSLPLCRHFLHLLVHLGPVAGADEVGESGADLSGVAHRCTEVLRFTAQRLYSGGNISVKSLS